MRKLSVRPPKAAVSPEGRARPQRNRLTPHRAGSSGVRSQESRLGPARFRTTHALLGPKPLTSSAIFCVSLVAGWALEAPPHNMVAAQLSAPIRSDPPPAATPVAVLSPGRTWQREEAGRGVGSSQRAVGSCIRVSLWNFLPPRRSLCLAGVYLTGAAPYLPGLAHSERLEISEDTCVQTNLYWGPGWQPCCPCKREPVLPDMQLGAVKFRFLPKNVVWRSKPAGVSEH